MAKVKSAYLNEIRGTVAKRLTFRKQKLKADQTLQKIPVPSYTRTTAQDNVRRGYRRLCDIWKTADWLDKEVYANFAEKHEITTFNSFLKYNMPVMSRKPVLYLSLDEGQGTTAHDLSEYQNNGTIYGATWQKLKTGKNALYFDGVDDYVEVPDSPSLDIADEITVMAWVKPAESKRQVIVSKRKTSTGWLFQINEDNRLYIYLQGVNGSAEANSTSKITIGQWNHVTFIGKMNDVGTFAINGVLEEWKSLSIVGDITNDEPVQIGTYASGEYGRWFNGLIAHVSIYNRALSESEIKKIYETTKVLFD